MCCKSLQDRERLEVEQGAGGGRQVWLEHLQTLISLDAFYLSLVSGRSEILQCSGKFGLSFPACV